MFSFLLALVLFIIQIPIKTAILTLKAVKGIKSGVSKSKDKSNEIRDRINKTSNDSNSIKNKVKGVKNSSKKFGNKDAEVRDKVNKTSNDNNDIKNRLKGAKNISKNILFTVTKYSLKALKSLLILVQLLISVLLTLGLFGYILLLILILILAGSVGYVVLMNDTISRTSSGIGTGFNPNQQIEQGDGSSNVVVDVDTSSLEACCKTMADWYIKNINTYQQMTSGNGSGYRKYYNCDILYNIKSDATAGDDCSGFAAVYASLVAGKWIPPNSSKGMYKGDSNFTNAGWARYTIAEIGGVSGLKTGDILVCNKDADENCKGHHAEIFLGQSSSFGWGKVQSSYPSSSSSFIDADIAGYIDQGSSHRYGVIYRYIGSSS